MAALAWKPADAASIELVRIAMAKYHIPKEDLQFYLTLVRIANCVSADRRDLPLGRTDGPMSAPKPARTDRGGGTRRQILDQAARLLRTNGYASTSLRDIAAATGMKAGSLYYHFASKEALAET